MQNEQGLECVVTKKVDALSVCPLGKMKFIAITVISTVAHRGHDTYMFISRDKKTVYRAIIWIYRAIIFDLSRDNSQFIARYKNVGTVSSMGHRTFLSLEAK